ncbi:BREX-2 system phosphatase PglZ [Micromonospora sp. NPDC003197]
MTLAPANMPALRINPVALGQKVAQQLDRHRNGDAYPVMVVRAEPAWPYEPVFALPDGRTVRVVPCLSPLAIWEHLVAERDDEVLVLLTDLPECQLGSGIRSRVFRQRLIPVQPWDLVMDAFGVQSPDTALEAESWASEALLDAMPPTGWPKLTAAILTRDVAMRHLAAVRLGLDRFGGGPEGLDVAMLLWWSSEPAAVEAFRQLRFAERDGLSRWLVEQLGNPAQALLALVAAGHGPDALPLGLVCAEVWGPRAPDARAQGRIDQYFGDLDRDDDTIRGFAGAAVQVVTAMLAVSDRELAVRRQGHAILDRAEELLIQFGAKGSGVHSAILRSGFTHRLGVAAEAMLEAVRSTVTPELESAVGSLAAHLLADAESERVRQVRMALRLLRWLDTAVDLPVSVADGVDRQIAEWSWVDVALNHVWAGEEVHPTLQAALREIYHRAAQRRRDLDAAFARRLGAWATAGPASDGDLLTVENLLPRIVEPLVRANHPTLLVLLDGMSAAVAVELADQLSQHWVEYDPRGVGRSRRRGVVAALPTLTSVSRTSLFAGTLRSGTQETERQIFAKGRWGSGARIFHKGPSRGGAGEVFSGELADAIATPEHLVAVVINAVDDSLAYGRDGDEAGWQLDDVGFLRNLLNLARSAGRAVIITSDHGHVLERGGEQLRATDALSARHRTGEGVVRAGEIELTGPRVVAADHRIVALWDPQLRYRPSRAGYHGGASLAEVTIPLLAFLMPNVENAPTGWTAIEVRHPDWWQATKSASAAVPLPPVPKPRRKAPVVAGEALFDVPGDEPPLTAEPPVGDRDLVTLLLETELFKAQRGLLPRPVSPQKIGAALRALLDANGVLPTAVLADRAGEAPARAGGFVNTLQRIFNVDNYPVLTAIDNGRNARLDARLLREQFKLPEGAS